MGDNPPKGGLIPHISLGLRAKKESRKAFWEGLAAYQVVGGVMAHQAEDG